MFSCDSHNNQTYKITKIIKNHFFCYSWPLLPLNNFYHPKISNLLPLVRCPTSRWLLFNSSETWCPKKQLKKVSVWKVSSHEDAHRTRKTKNKIWSFKLLKDRKFSTVAIFFFLHIPNNFFSLFVKIKTNETCLSKGF